MLSWIWDAEPECLLFWLQNGAATVYGIDIDAVAAQSAFDNAKLNRVGTKVKTRYGDASLLQRVITTCFWPISTGT